MSQQISLEPTSSEKSGDPLPSEPQQQRHDGGDSSPPLQRSTDEHQPREPPGAYYCYPGQGNENIPVRRASAPTRRYTTTILEGEAMNPEVNPPSLHEEASTVSSLSMSISLERTTLQIQERERQYAQQARRLDHIERQLRQERLRGDSLLQQRQRQHHDDELSDHHSDPAVFAVNAQLVDEAAEAERERLAEERAARLEELEEERRVERQQMRIMAADLHRLQQQLSQAQEQVTVERRSEPVHQQEQVMAGERPVVQPQALRQSMEEEESGSLGRTPEEDVQQETQQEQQTSHSYSSEEEQQQQQEGSPNRGSKCTRRILPALAVVIAVVVGVVVAVTLAGSDKSSLAKELSPSPSPSIDFISVAPPNTSDISEKTLPPTEAVSPVRQQINWLLATAFTPGVEITTADMEEHFTKVFRQLAWSDNYLLGKFLDIQSRVEGRAQIDRVIDERSYSAEFRVGDESESERFDVSITVFRTSPHLIANLYVQELSEEFNNDTPQSLSELADHLKGLAAGSAYLAAEIIGGKCSTISGSYNQDRPAPLGPASAVYVLGALVQAILAGDHDWTDELAIREDLKSLPIQGGTHGTMQKEAAGTLFTLLAYARNMIHFNDNTATDHLIDLLGREQVEALQTHMGHHNASVNTPFLTTGDWFRIKAGLDDSQTMEYLGLDMERKRQFLKNLSDQIDLDNLDLSILGMPRFIDSVGWFATPNDICRAYAGLWNPALDANKVVMRHILEFDQSGMEKEDSLEFLGVKGGWDAGVFTFVAVADRSDGRTYVQVLSLADPKKPLLLEHTVASDLVEVGFGLLAELFPVETTRSGPVAIPGN